MPDPEGIILCIPGIWANRKEFVLAVAGADSGYLFAGAVLHHAKSGIGWTLEFCQRDERMQDSFAVGGMGRMEPAQIELIGKHRSVVYLISDNVGVDAAVAIRHAASALLDAGGLGVKCEISGAALGAKQWKERSAVSFPSSLYHCFVLLISGEDDYYTCGMRALGLPDAAVSSKLELQEAWDLLGEFNLYNLAESPVLKSGETFSINENAPKYRMRAVPYRWYPPDDLFHNPKGAWELVRV